MTRFNATVEACVPLVAEIVNVTYVGGGGVESELLPPPQALMLRTAKAATARNTLPSFLVFLPKATAMSAAYAKGKVPGKGGSECICAVAGVVTVTVNGTEAVEAASVSEAGRVHCTPVSAVEGVQVRLTTPAKLEFERVRL
jgi:hypothetical protein